MYGASHGDTRHIILIPHDMNSCFDFARQSFNYADRFQTPIFVAHGPRSWHEYVVV